jgi:hypothetical protein
MAAAAVALLSKETGSHPVIPDCAGGFKDVGVSLLGGQGRRNPEKYTLRLNGFGALV